MIMNPKLITVPTNILKSETFPMVSAGQIWRDRKRGNSNRLLIVLDASQARIVCQSLNTGIISKVRREQFNRGEQAFKYAADIHDICQMFNNYRTAKPVPPKPSVPVTKPVVKLPIPEQPKSLINKTIINLPHQTINNRTNNNPL